jgi:tRNA (cytidine32/uridine32-2'-O)-methyltransferase
MWTCFQVMLDNIRFILVNTSHPGNIGSAARAMKTMGLSELYLVAPVHFPHPKAQELASNATDVLEHAIVVDTLEQAIADCQLVLGTSTRARTIPWPILSPREFASLAQREAMQTKIAVVFGREQSGLTNEELHLCHYHIQIPTNPDYSSLNIAAALQVIAYELRVASLSAQVPLEKWDYAFADGAQMEGFYEHLHDVLIAIEFLNPKVPRQLMPRLRRLFTRARPDVMEMNILRGILGAIDKSLKK